MELKTSNILAGVVLLGGIAHLMLFMNGLWNNMFLVSAMAMVGIPIIIHKYTKSKGRQRRLAKLRAKDL